MTPAQPQAVKSAVPFGAAERRVRRPHLREPYCGVGDEVRKRMSKITRHVVGLTTENFPIVLVGTGVIATVLWTCIVTALAIEQVWSMLSGV